MICSKCGTENGEESVYCNKCGDRIDINANDSSDNSINQYKPNRKKWVICSILLFIIIIIIFAITSLDTQRETGMGVSASDVLRVYEENDLKFIGEYGVKIDEKYPNWVGQTENGGDVLQFIGPKNDLIKSELSFGISDNGVSAIKGLLESGLLMKTLFPDWKGSYKWLQDNLVIITQNEQPIILERDNKYIHISYLSAVGMYTLSICTLEYGKANNMITNKTVTSNDKKEASKILNEFSAKAENTSKSDVSTSNQNEAVFQLKDVRIGMNKAQVRELVGNPVSEEDGSKDWGSIDWKYTGAKLSFTGSDFDELSSIELEQSPDGKIKTSDSFAKVVEIYGQPTEKSQAPNAENPDSTFNAIYSSANADNLVFSIYENKVDKIGIGTLYTDM